ncbi:MAG: hypothetical protein KAT46_07705 [Deltaproteobacteria bacterium]|nr:hypothetical protein [Deltaproteobacteria bacterium]
MSCFLREKKCSKTFYSFRVLIVVVNICLVNFFTPSMVVAEEGVPIVTSPEQTSTESTSSGNIYVLIGTKELNPDEWYPVEDQLELSVLADFKMDKEWLFSVVMATAVYAGYGTAWDPFLGDIDVLSSTEEISIGGRFIDENLSGKETGFQPFVSGGLSLITTRYEAEALGVTISDEDTAIGIWGDAGFYYQLGGLNFGAVYRLSSADVNLFGANVDVGGDHLGVFAGLHF